VRRNGELNVVHCLEAAKILAETTKDRVMVAAGLLHDVLDDTQITEAALERLIGSEVTSLVAGVSKMGNISQIVRDTAGTQDMESRNVDNLRTLILAMTDPRAVIVKLADRLHNLRTLDALPHHKQQGIARETLDIFANLARRLGVWNIKTEMEDICFKYLMPVEYGNLKARLAEGYDLHESVEGAVREVDAALRAKGVGYVDLSGRPKNLYSIYSKMEQ
jgi:GTP pyrophosphokinase